jgi:hypothetical protein
MQRLVATVHMNSVSRPGRRSHATVRIPVPRPPPPGRAVDF